MPCTAGPTRCSRAAENEREARARAAERRERLHPRGRAAEAVGAAVGVVLRPARGSVACAGGRARDRGRAVPAASASSDLLAVRATLRDLGREHDELVNSVHRDEMARTQQRMRIEQLEERALEELGLDADGLVADYGPDQLVPFTGEVEEGEPSRPSRRRTSARSSRSGCAPPSARSSMLGRVNPLALEEFSRDGGAAQVPHRAARGPQADPQATCSTSSARSTRGSSRSSPRRTPTSSRPSSRPSPGCSPAARAGWC